MKLTDFIHNALSKIEHNVCAHARLRLHVRVVCLSFDQNWFPSSLVFGLRWLARSGIRYRTAKVRADSFSSNLCSNWLTGTAHISGKHASTRRARTWHVNKLTRVWVMMFERLAPNEDECDWQLQRHTGDAQGGRAGGRWHAHTAGNVRKTIIRRQYYLWFAPSNPNGFCALSWMRNRVFIAFEL